MTKKAKKENNLLSKNSGFKKRVIVAMSGGVDSSVAAALLKEAGDFEVIGVFMKFGTEIDFAKSHKGCCSPETEKRARIVANSLEIPFYIFDFKKEFKQKVFDYFLKKFKEGATPNPCIVCNKEIKFGLLLEKALEVGADFIATGHYARIREQKDRLRLIKGKDGDKDQSYFLWKLSQRQLKSLLFPVGGYTKHEVRKLARDFRLPIVDFPESQEICFIPKTVADFLKKHLKTNLGEIIEHETKKVLGKHEGLWFYTIGQRKGIRLAGGPFYVLDKDIKNNTLLVTKNEKDLYQRKVSLKSINWILGKTPKLPLKLKAKIRYRHKAAEGIVSKLKGKRYSLWFKAPQRAVTCGQSAVFYHRDEVLGGGIIC